MTPRLLIVEDERAIQLALRGLFKREGYDVDLADTGEEAIRRHRDEPYDLVLTDLALGRGMSGMEVLRSAKERRPETAVVTTFTACCGENCFNGRTVLSISRMFAIDNPGNTTTSSWSINVAS